MQQSTLSPFPIPENRLYMKGFLLAFTHQLKMEKMKTRSSLLLAAIAIILVSFTEHKSHAVHKRFFNLPNGTISIIIDKSDYELRVYDEDGWYATYPVVFGSDSQDDKMMEGDRKTPEGSYSIVAKRPHEKWDKFFSLNYPTAADIAKFNQRKADGRIPAGARIGGGIGIHGTWPRDDMVIDYYQNWTNGCISMKREDVEDLYSYCPVGTRVTIQQ
jgi:murein L,D-transpeptidase YafK